MGSLKPEGGLQPICTVGTHGNCPYLFQEGSYFGCQAGAVRQSWAHQKSETYAELYVARIEELGKHRNYRIRVCLYRLLHIVHWSASPSPKTASLARARTSLLGKLSIGKVLVVVILLGIVGVLVGYRGWCLAKISIGGFEFAPLAGAAVCLPPPVPPRIVPELIQIPSSLDEVTLCSKDPTRPAAVRIVAGWLHDVPRPRLRVSVEQGLGIVALRVVGWKAISDVMYPLDASENLARCGYADTWLYWNGPPDAVDPPVEGSHLTFKFLGVDQKVVLAVELAVEHHGLRLIRVQP